MTKSGRWIFGVATACVTLLGSQSAFAGISTYSTLADWQSVVAGLTTVTIPELASPGFASFGTGTASVVYSGVTFSTVNALDSDSILFNVSAAFSGQPAVVSSQQGVPELTDLMITLPSPVTAIAFNYGSFLGSQVTFALSNGDSIVQASTASGYQTTDLFAITDDTAFSSVLLTLPSDTGVNVNNLVYGNAAAPEPSFYGVLGLGMACLLVISRRRAARNL